MHGIIHKIMELKTINIFCKNFLNLFNELKKRLYIFIRFFFFNLYNK